MIEPGKIPTFTGKLDVLETHAAALKTTASNIRGTGKDVHNAFQALGPSFDTPHTPELLATTAPVRDKADDFAKKLETVSGALSTFATTAKPLVDKMDRLRHEAETFVKDNKGDDDWKKDQKKVDQNEHLVHEVGATWAAFQAAERDAANKITALVKDGTHFVLDDGSHKAGMYGFKADDVAKADETPWGKVDKREYTGLRAAWEWTKDNVGGALKGFFVDGVWGTLKGLGSMVNVFDWDNFKKTWSGIGDVFGGVSAYLMTPYDWAMDKMFGPVDHSDTDRQKAALRDFGKSMVAWDEWGKDPSRAFGTVLFNAVTLGSGTALKLGKAGKLGAASEAVAAVGRAGALADPMTYISKAGGVAKLKVGDFFNGLKASQTGLDDLGRNLPAGKGAHPGEVSVPPVHGGEASVPQPHAGETPSAPTRPAHGAEAPSAPSKPASQGLPYTDHAGNERVVGGDGVIRDKHGDPVPDTEPVREPHKSDLPNNAHETAPAKEDAKVLEGAGGPGHVEGEGAHPASPHSPPAQPTSTHHPTDGGHPTGGGSGGPNTTPHTGGGHVSDHPTGGGSGSHGSQGGGSLPPAHGGGGGHGTPGHGGGHDGPGPEGGHGGDAHPASGDHGHDGSQSSEPRHEPSEAPHDVDSGAGHGSDDHQPTTDAEGAEHRGGDEASHTMRSDYIAPDDPKSRVPALPKEHGDIVLSTGDHVYFEPGLTTIGYDDMSRLNREMTARIEGYHDVVVHGNNKGFFMPGRKNAAGVDFPPGEVSAGHIIEAIRNNPSYNGGPIRLISCHTGVLKEGELGIPAAQAVANELKVPVMAPTDEVGIYPSRGKGQQPEVQNGGYWRTFLPLLQ